ncbi:MAG: Na+/H+ antiporter subunit E [Myxococcota bacterium]|jgi:multisubunit Na+/H+ antiporter MnhE subunit|nr:Na+/H+ antiporter subunit E [Myxococcota bacterium]
MMRLFRGLGVFLRFLVDLVSSGLTTAWMILRPPVGREAGLVRIEIAGLNRRGALLLACMVTLTPGSTVIDVDFERDEMLLHLLDTRQLSQSICELRRRFVEPMIRLFPKEAKHA